MLQVFRDNQFLTVIFVFLYFGVFGANILLYPNLNLDNFQELPSTWGQLLMSWISLPLLNQICFSLLILIQAFTINALVNQYKLSKEYSFITAVCFIVLHFTYPNIDSCSPPVVANTFLLWALYSLLGSYDKKVSLGTIFNIGFAVAIAALIYHGCIVYFLWAVFGLLIIRSFDLQEFILLVSGFFIPFFLLGAYHFLGNNFDNWWQNTIGVHYSNMNVLYDSNTSLYIMLAILVIPFFLALGNLQGLYEKTTTREKKYINAVLLMPIIGLLSFFVQNNLYSFHYIVFFVPISILLSISLQSYKSRVIAELIHFVLFMLCLGIQYQTFFFQS